MRARHFCSVVTIAFWFAAATTTTFAAERLPADAPRTTVAGNTFIAPADWSIEVRGRATILEVPEGGSFIALIDIPVSEAKDHDAALKAAWAAYKPDATWLLKVTSPVADVSCTSTNRSAQASGIRASPRYASR